MKSDPRGGVRPFHQKANFITQSILGTHVVHIWSRKTPNAAPTKSLRCRRRRRRKVGAHLEREEAEMRERADLGWDVNERVPAQIPHGGARPNHQKSTCLTESTVGAHLIT